MLSFTDGMLPLLTFLLMDQSGASLRNNGISGVKDTSSISVHDSNSNTELNDSSVPNGNSCIISDDAQTNKHMSAHTNKPTSIGDAGSGKRDRSPTLSNNSSCNESKKPRVEERSTTKLIEDIKNILYQSVDTLSDPDKFSLYNSQHLEDVLSMSKCLLDKIENV